jgi:hypothetical protein
LPTKDDPRVVVRFARAEHDLVQAAAKDRGLSVAAFVREAAAMAVGNASVTRGSSASPGLDKATFTAVVASARRRRCSEHPEAGAVQVNGRWFCKEPGCPNLLNP